MSCTRDTAWTAASQTEAAARNGSTVRGHAGASAKGVKSGLSCGGMVVVRLSRAPEAGPGAVPVYS